MKIYYLSNSIIPSSLANSVHVMKMCQAFSENGHNVILYGRSPNSQNNSRDPFSFYGIETRFNIININWPNIRGIGGVFFGLNVKRDIIKNGLPDLFYGRDLYSLLLVRTLGVPFIYEAHTFPTGKCKQLMEEILLKSDNFKRLVVISNALKKNYLNNFSFLKEDKVVVAHDAADLPKKDNKFKIKAKLKGDRNKPKVGYIGHLYPGKGMEIITELSQRVKDVEFHVIGGNKEDIEYWKGKEHSENLYFYGFIPHGELFEYYNSFDILLAPYQSRVTGFGGKGDISKWMSPLKLFEYMSYKKAIIASNLPVIQEVLKHNYNSILCEPDNVKEWESAIIELLNNKNKMKIISDNAYNDFIKNYTWKKRSRNVLL